MRVGISELAGKAAGIERAFETAPDIEEPPRRASHHVFGRKARQRAHPLDQDVRCIE
jgi:hypothetical protein